MSFFRSKTDATCATKIGLSGSLIILIVFTLSVSKLVVSDTFKILFDQANAKPYAFIEDKQLVRGIIKDLGDTIARELAIDVDYVLIPRKRYDWALMVRKVHLSLQSN
ncbi:hypothetical protein [Spartinivicinus poritis]|uniref:Uncharacterized protein n=1 Tax=Spartinivicinus poritis TaxID=2994640 RepID=A0ABT5U421_9GAMM|nr:hypothetical protein [Spartinivicinus sp. A2-2]MDE1460965.1 hypothetical protein [Spartinivicinus sp. A2-2]